MNSTDLMILIPILFLLFLSITLGIYIYSNRQLLKELKEDSEDNEIKMKNIINAVNYNDTKLMENQKYLYDVYEENKMRLGDTFKEKKSVSQLNEKPQFDVQQYPMQNELKKQYKTSKIETDVNPQWVRGGLDSRLLYQNIEYSKK